MAAEPDLSVVVATHRRETRLAFLLEALEGQTLPRERFEVIVVEDETGAGPGATRNRGVEQARGRLVVFTDDDCRPAPDWLEWIAAAAEAGDGDLVIQGRTEPDPDEAGRLHGFARSQWIVGPSPWYQACNIAYPRALLERLGGFDPAFDGGGEDADLGLRAVAAGARPVYVDGARVWHAVHSRHLWQAVREESRWHTIPLVLARHPSQRAALELGLFWKAGHPRLLLALAGLLAARRAPLLGALAAVPYVRQHLRGYGRSPRDLARAGLDLPGRALVDGAGIVATARAAIRHRAAVV